MNNQGQNGETSNNHANTQGVEEQSPPAGPTIYVPNPELRAVIETRVQIAMERQRRGQPLTFEDVMALDYEDALRHLNQQNHTQTQNEQERPRQQQQQEQRQPTQHDIQLQLQLHIEQQRRRQQEQQEQRRRRRQQQKRTLKNCQIWREAEIMHNLGRENFEPINKENAELCSICLVNYDIGEEIGRLDCAHKFHMKCIKDWLLLKNKCPLCNRMGLYLE